MYYCKERYYVPQWRRWLTPDNPKFLGSSNINNLNLFVYCGNNPTMHFDLSGNIYVSVEDPRISKEKMLVKADCNRGPSYGPKYSPPSITGWIRKTFSAPRKKDDDDKPICHNEPLDEEKIKEINDKFFKEFCWWFEDVIEPSLSDSDMSQKGQIESQINSGSQFYSTNGVVGAYETYNWSGITKLYGSGFKVYFEQIDYRNEEEDLFPMW